MYFFYFIKHLVKVCMCILLHPMLYERIIFLQTQKLKNILKTNMVGVGKLTANVCIDVDVASQIQHVCWDGTEKMRQKCVLPL